MRLAQPGDGVLVRRVPRPRAGRDGEGARRGDRRGGTGSPVRHPEPSGYAWPSGSTTAATAKAACGSCATSSTSSTVAPPGSPTTRSARSAGARTGTRWPAPRTLGADAPTPTPGRCSPRPTTTRRARDLRHLGARLPGDRRAPRRSRRWPGWRPRVVRRDPGRRRAVPAACPGLPGRRPGRRGVCRRPAGVPGRQRAQRTDLRACSSRAGRPARPRRACSRRLDWYAARRSPIR